MSAIDYTRVNFQDYPNTKTPITAQNLNKLDKGIYDLDIALTQYISAHQSYSRNISWYGTSSTAASTIAKTATTSDGKFSLATGAKVSIKFTYDNTASAPTLNVDSTGAKSIKAYGTTAPTSWWQAGDVVTFTYDGTNWIMGATEGQIAQINSKLIDVSNRANIRAIYFDTYSDTGQYGTIDLDFTTSVYEPFTRIIGTFFLYDSGMAIEGYAPVAVLRNDAHKVTVLGLPKNLSNFRIKGYVIYM